MILLQNWNNNSESESAMVAKSITSTQKLFKGLEVPKNCSNAQKQSHCLGSKQEKQGFMHNLPELFLSTSNPLNSFWVLVID